jgi:cytidylate kinase
MTQSFITVAIDGPAGAGKSTTARRLAEDLGIVYVDSGAMYRAVALFCLKAGINYAEIDKVADLAAGLTIEFAPPEKQGEPQRLYVDGQDVTGAIRTPEISAGASTVSTIPAVRETLVAKQRAMGQKGGVVMEGRDIGTVVLPDAPCKIFLTASLDERARRRHVEMLERGESAVIDEVKADIAERDHRDETRTVSPLRPASDAVILNSDGMTADQVIQKLRMLALSSTVKYS